MLPGMSDLPATDPRLVWTGRTRSGADGAVTAAFPGVTLDVALRGTRLELDVEASTGDCHVEVTVDGGQPRIIRLPAGASVLVAAEGLEAGTVHRIRLLRRTESWVGVLTVRALRAAGGACVQADPPPTRRLLFIGDSVTCGACTELLPPDWPEGHANSNAARSFGMELGRRLGAAVHLVSYGGRGLVRDWQGLDSERDGVATAPVFFERTLPDEAAPAWDHAAWQPDAVVVGLGTNDFNQGITDERAWTAAYDRFLARIRAVHAQAWILITSSAMFGPRLDNGDAAKAAALAHYLDETVQLRLQARDQRVERVLYRYQPGCGKNGHPNAPQHLQMADDLEPVLRARLGWFS